MNEPARHPVQATKTTFRVIDALRERDGAGVTELASALGMHKSTVHNHLSTLLDEGYVVRDGDGYRLGLRFLELGGAIRSRSRLYAVAGTELTRLADQTGELATLATMESGECVYLTRAKGERALDLDTYAGSRALMHTTALGKAMLAFASDKEVKRILDTHGLPARTAQSITDRAALYDELDRIREEGVARDDEERLDGLRCVAVPIRTTAGDPLGAIGVSAPTSRLAGTRFEREVPKLVSGAANVVELSVRHA